MAIRTVVTGSARGMGRMPVAQVLQDPGLPLSGALESPPYPFLGQDAAQVAGLPPCGVPPFHA